MAISSDTINEILNGNPFTAIPEADKEDYLGKFQKSILDQRKAYPLPEPIVTLHQNGLTIPLLTRKSFSLWQGKQN